MRRHSVLTVRFIASRLVAVLLFALATQARSQSNLKITFGTQGIQTLAYKQVLLEDTGTYTADNFHIWHMKSTDLSGNLISSGQYGWGESNNGRSWDSVAHAWTYQFNWGTIRVQYVQRGDILDIVVTSTNNFGSGIVFDGASIYPLALHFPQLPTGFVDATYNWFGDNTSAPGITTADYGTGQVSMAMPDASTSLYSGFQGTGVSNAYTALLSGTSPDSLAAFLPHYDRKLQPGQTDTYTVSLRFAPSGTDPSSLAADVYQSWDTLHPSTLTWNDRRAIGTVYLASSPSGDKTQPGGYLNNPRRYFNDSNAADFDVRTASGLLAFQHRVLQQAQENVTNLKRLNAQGAITWDLEGEQYPQDTSYVCSPDQLATVAPEMETVVRDTSSPYLGMKLDDAYFRTMTDAGMRVGVCVRPQQFTINADGSAQQTTLDNSLVAAQLIRKMRYAHDRWGATLFYLDSTVNALGGTLEASIFEQAAAALPDSLLIPEETTSRHYASTAPFKTFIFHGDLGTDAAVYNFYPNAFGATLVNDVDAATLAAAQAKLTQAVKMGDILMTHVDYWQQNNPTILAIYQAAGKWTNPASLLPKTTTLTLGASASSMVFGKPLTLTATLAPVAATGTISFYDAGSIVGTATAAGGVASLLTSSLPIGTHALTAVYAGSTTYAGSSSFPVAVTVTAMPTTLALVGSAASTTVGLPITFTATLSGGATGTVAFYDGASLLGTGVSSGTTATLSTSALTVGTYTIKAVYTGVAGFADSASNTVAAVITPPIVTTTSLQMGTSSITLGSAMTLTATAQPAAATGTMTFYDGTSVVASSALNSGRATVSTSTLTLGTHSLTAFYGGSTLFAASTSPAATAVVSAVPAVVSAVPAVVSALQAVAPTTANLLADPGFELQKSGTLASPWAWTGPSAHGADVALGNAHTGANNAFIWDASSNWNAISQTVTVQPNTEYVFSAWVRSGLVANEGYVSVLAGQTILSETSFGNLPGYTRLWVRFNSGANTAITTRVGFWGRWTPQWIQIDDLALRPNLLVNPGFELQSRPGLASPWTGIGTSSQGVDIALGNANSGLNNGYVWDASGTWNAIAQTVTVTPNTSYLLTGWVRDSLTGTVGSLGVDGSSSVLGETSFGSLWNYTPVSVSFNSGSNTSVKVRAGFTGQWAPRWMQVDDFTLEQTQ